METRKIIKEGFDLSEIQTCFVISPIGKEGSEIYEKFKNVMEYVIKPSVKNSEYKLKVLRADDVDRAGSFINPDGHPKYPICGHLSLLHLYFYLRGMKKEENMVIQVPIRHTELKYESDGGAYYPAIGGAF